MVTISDSCLIHTMFDQHDGQVVGLFLIFLYHFPKLLLKAFQIYFQWEDGGGPEKD